jgi:hypothetical protein
MIKFKNKKHTKAKYCKISKNKNKSMNKILPISEEIKRIEIMKIFKY